LNRVFEFRFNGENGLSYEKFIVPKDKPERVAVVNPAYGFVLERVRSGDPWLVKYVERGGGSARDIVDDNGRVLAELFLQIWDKMLPEFVTEPNFAVTAMRSVEREGKGYAQIDFSYNEPFTQAQMTILTGGTILLDPDHYWVIKEYQLRRLFEDGATSYVTGAIDYATGVGGFPILRRRIEKVSTSKGDRAEMTCEFTKYEHREVPEDEFMLSAFGLPEPTFTQSSPARLWVCLISVALLLFCLAVFAYRRLVNVRGGIGSGEGKG
jgi:hypothetical protein